MLILENLRGKKKKTEPSSILLMPEILTSKKKPIVCSVEGPFSKRLYFELNMHLNLKYKWEYLIVAPITMALHPIF